MEINRPHNEYFKRSPVDPTGFIQQKTKELVEKVVAEKPDCLVFLDKSARPLALFFVYAWEKYGKGQMPKIKFLNIGRERKPEQLSDRDKNKLNLFKSNILATSPEPKILVVDEAEHTGRTQENVNLFFKKYFAEAQHNFYAFLDITNRPSFLDNLPLTNIFPWTGFFGSDMLLIDTHMDIEDGNIVEDFFSSALEEVGDSRVGNKLRQQIRDLYED